MLLTAAESPHGENRRRPANNATTWAAGFCQHFDLTIAALPPRRQGLRQPRRGGSARKSPGAVAEFSARPALAAWPRGTGWLPADPAGKRRPTGTRSCPVASVCRGRSEVDRVLQVFGGTPHRSWLPL